MNAADILGISSPEVLFPREPIKAQELYRQLMQTWHPDKKGGREDVAAHLNVLYIAREKLMEDGRWDAKGKLSVKAKQYDVWHDIDYYTKQPFELGVIYVGPGHVTYEIPLSYQDLFDNGVRSIKGLRYADPAMRTEISRYMPEIVKDITTFTSRVLVVKRNADQLMLRDVLTKLKKIEPVHVAWMVSSCYNLGCYLWWSKAVHNAPLLESLFVTPEKHSVSLLGGWWYSEPMTGKLKALPSVATTGVIALPKKPSHRIYLDLVKRSARELLGDPEGTKLLSDLTIPNALLRYLQIPAVESPLEEYGLWKKVLTEAFGAKKFHVFNVKHTDIYK